MFTSLLRTAGAMALCLGTAAIATPPEAAGIPDRMPLNRIQVLGTHNSYSQGVDPHVIAMLEKALPNMDRMVSALPPEKLAEFRTAHPNPVSFSEMLNYRHPSLTEQLDLGVRGLEIDINADPAGGAYADPAAYRILRAQGVTDLLPYDPTPMKAPGIKVLHMADIDFRSSCPTFRDCLTEMKAWSDAHPRHVPIFVMIEAKVQSIALLPGSAKAQPITIATYDEMDRTITEVIGHANVVMPDDVRGRYPTLEKAVLAGHWPTLGQARGKFVFLLSTATGHDGASDYLIGHEGLKGRMAFLDSQPGQSHAAFILDDNALARGNQIREEVAKGYLVRSRADIETYEAKTNDMTRANAAFASGAQIVSTDFEKPGNAYGTPYTVTVPGGGPARIAPRR